MLLQIAPAVDTAAVMDMAAAVVQTKEKIPIMDLAIKGGWIMIPIVLLLLVSIYVFVERWIVISKASKNEAGLMYSIRDYILDGRLDSAKTLCCNTDTPTAHIIEKGIDRVGKPTRDGDRDGPGFLRYGIQRQQYRGGHAGRRDVPGYGDHGGGSDCGDYRLYLL